MEKVLVTISQAPDGSYWCHTESDVYGSGLNGAGASVKEAKADYIENGCDIYEVDFSYQYDLQSFFEYFSFLNVTDIAKRAGINPSLMRQYARGIKNAGEKTYARLSGCIGEIAKELQAASFRV